MILIALIVIASTGVGVLADRRTPLATRVSQMTLRVMLYGLLPFVAFVNFAHLRLSLGAGLGLVGAYVGLGLAGLAAWLLGRRLGLDRPGLGALIIAVILVNTGYLGLPASTVLLGRHALTHAVAYDQVISGPMVFTVGFAVGAAFGTRARRGRGLRRSLGAFVANPPLWAALAGLMGGPSLAPQSLLDVSNVIVKAFIVLGFFAVGVALSSERREEGAGIFERPDRAVLAALAVRFSVNPALLGLLSLAGLGVPSAYLLQAAMPSGVNGLIIAHAYGLDQRLVATTIVWSTLAVLVVAIAFAV